MSDSDLKRSRHKLIYTRRRLRFAPHRRQVAAGCWLFARLCPPPPPLLMVSQATYHAWSDSRLPHLHVHTTEVEHVGCAPPTGRYGQPHDRPRYCSFHRLYIALSSTVEAFRRVRDVTERFPNSKIHIRRCSSALLVGRGMVRGGGAGVGAGARAVAASKARRAVPPTPV